MPVSIPHRKFKNLKNITVEHMILLEFPSLIGSSKTEVLKALKFAKVEFPSLIGSSKTEQAPGGGGVCRGFHPS